MSELPGITTYRKHRIDHDPAKEWLYSLRPLNGKFNWFTKAQANEIIRRCKAYEGLAEALRKIIRNEITLRMSMAKIAGSEEVKKRWQNMKSANETLAEQALAEAK